MKKLLIIIIPFLISSCEKSKESLYNYNCRSQYQKDPFTLIVKDTTFVNITQSTANDYVRKTSVNGWYTTCDRQ